MLPMLILCIGDSISLGYFQYMPPAQHPADNCRTTRYTLEHLDEWAPPEKHWDVIVFNCGLHDVANRVPPDEYVANLREIVTRLRARCDRLYFCSTTPGRPQAMKCTPALVDLYNCGALGVMNQERIPVIDLYGPCMAHHDWWQGDCNIHYTEDGYRGMAKFILSKIGESNDRK